METLQEGGFSNLVTQLKAFFFPKSGGNVSGSVNASGEVTAHETVSGSSVAHNLTEKLDEEDYLHGMTWDELEARFTWDDLDGTSSQTEDTETPNLGLLKPGRLSTVGFNGNMDILDEAIEDLQESVFSWKDVSITIRAGHDLETVTVSGATRIIGATLLYDDGLYYLTPYGFSWSINNGNILVVRVATTTPSDYSLTFRVIYL